MYRISGPSRFVCQTGARKVENGRATTRKGRSQELGNGQLAGALVNSHRSLRCQREALLPQIGKLPGASSPSSWRLLSPVAPWPLSPPPNASLRGGKDLLWDRIPGLLIPPVFFDAAHRFRWASPMRVLAAALISRRLRLVSWCSRENHREAVLGVPFVRVINFDQTPQNECDTKWRNVSHI